MRTLKSNADDTFRVKAYAGTNGVLLGCDLDPLKRRNFLGFAIEQKEGTKPWQWLLNSLTFPGYEHTIKKWNATPSNMAPIQKFRWADYSVEPKTTCMYRVHLAYGAPDAVELGESITISVKTDDGNPMGQRVIFNRAVAASQAFGKHFPDMDAFLSANNNPPIESWPAAPRDWLQNGLLDQIIAFINRAKDAKWALDIAIYEYELAAIVDAVNAAHKRGVAVRVVYHAQNGDEQTTQNELSLKKIPAAKKHARITSKIFHDKFIVLSKVMASGEHKPESVLTGSTNFTENGVYRQANVVHIIDSKVHQEVTDHYAALFEVVWDNPNGTAETKKWINANNPIDKSNNFFVGFSPRKGGADLAEFISVITSADKDLLFATAFALPETILDALLGAEHDAVLRYGIQNTSSRITGFHADRTADFTTPALLNKGLERWIKEGLKGQRGRLLVHLKAIVANFTTDSPIIISGSHNLSKPASESNDENYLIIRGDTDLADRYGIEILRFYEHYRFRYYANKLKLKAVRPLSVDDSWSLPFYQNGSLKASSRLRFAGR